SGAGNAVVVGEGLELRRQRRLRQPERALHALGREIALRGIHATRQRTDLPAAAQVLGPAAIAHAEFIERHALVVGRANAARADRRTQLASAELVAAPRLGV